MLIKTYLDFTLTVIADFALEGACLWSVMSNSCQRSVKYAFRENSRHANRAVFHNETMWNGMKVCNVCSLLLWLCFQRRSIPKCTIEPRNIQVSLIKDCDNIAASYLLNDAWKKIKKLPIQGLPAPSSLLFALTWPKVLRAVCLGCPTVTLMACSGLLYLVKTGKMISRVAIIWPMLKSTLFGPSLFYSKLA